MTLVAIGACYLDTILTAPYYPGEDEKLRASRISRRRGGNCPNTLEVLGQLLQYGPSSAESSLNLIAVLPSKSSVPCQQIQSSLGNMVRLDSCIYRERFSEPASSYIITSQATGSRTIVNYNELPEMTRTEFATAVDPLRPCTRGNIGMYSLSSGELSRAEISVEVEKPGRPGLQELADVADVVIYSKGWAQSNGYTSAEDCLRDQSLKTSRASLLCCTWGSDGAAALEPETGNFAHVPAHTEEVGVVDTIGAGDTFNAGLLYGLIYRGRDWGFRKKLEFANLIAGLKVTQEGFTDLQRALNVP
ncbi:hypothetical protein N7519_010166 [Penicillium mononematosum]|uniref:uncharacterized protein n=1 Tax=Penicillium mononematosum TaxID=268346 RepID=UPI002548B6B4|nr:uncharacterized protein N7519_010166 [Penicillium mononematosum]KAJ6179705.1 hypothetical protein N7519_010166 [Penicillium mononematosum]